jgi:hypothetical protein
VDRNDKMLERDRERKRIGNGESMRSLNQGISRMREERKKEKDTHQRELERKGGEKERE